MAYLKTGDLFAGMTVVAFCGHGAFGEVYAVCDGAGKYLALKIIRKDSPDGAWQHELNGLRRYGKVVRGCGALLQIYQTGELDDCIYCVMELADNAGSCDVYRADTLQKRLSEHWLPDAMEILKLMYYLLAGVRTLHLSRLAHRDIKPGNILFVDGCPKIADMGLLIREQSMTGNLSGTLDYITPEHRAKTGTLSGAECQEDDLYALGKIVYVLATGNEARQFPSIPATLCRDNAHRQLLQLANRLCTPNPHRRARTDEAVEKCLNETVRALDGKSPDRAHWLRWLSGGLAAAVLIGILPSAFRSPGSSEAAAPVAGLVPAVTVASGDRINKLHGELPLPEPEVLATAMDCGGADWFYEKARDLKDFKLPAQSTREKSINHVGVRFRIPENWNCDKPLGIGNTTLKEQSSNADALLNYIHLAWSLPEDATPEYCQALRNASPENVRLSMLYGSVICADENERKKCLISPLEVEKEGDMRTFRLQLTARDGGFPVKEFVRRLFPNNMTMTLELRASSAENLNQLRRIAHRLLETTELSPYNGEIEI